MGRRKLDFVAAGTDAGFLTVALILVNALLGYVQIPLLATISVLPNVIGVFATIFVATLVKDFIRDALGQ